MGIIQLGLQNGSFSTESGQLYSYDRLILILARIQMHVDNKIVNVTQIS